MSSDKVREQFEAWWDKSALRAKGVLSEEHQRLDDERAQAARWAWEAACHFARKAALEEAAVVCERISAASKRDGYGTEAAAEQGCADAIRALAGRGA